MKFFFLTLALFFGSQTIYGQSLDTIPRKKLSISKVQKAPKIDGSLDDQIWEEASIATDFVERLPQNGRKIPDSLRTEVRIVYDDLGVYFAASMLDPEPEKIRRELTERDAIGNDDFFFILLNGYNDRQQSMQFIVTAAGVQYDAKMTNGNEDSSWNGIWYSAVEINPTGWTAEIFIPYSELRFPTRKIQEWGLQMEREFRRTGTRYSWSPVDNTRGSYSIYDGELHGINDINTPTRLSFQPYVSTYLNNYDGETTLDINGGMDLKYGINDAFTLDMILVPDFGQTRFDATVLNLSAFEVQYDEQRPFFTEGTELFTKGNLFYSRRVGGAPFGSVSLRENEEVVSIPTSVDLLNAMKISGRTDRGLGIGFFNAVTQTAFATIRNTETDELREEVIEPLTNYNIVVLDQRFGDNSSFSFVNTSTLRQRHFRDANATGLYLNLTNKRNTWNYRAGAEGSLVRVPGDEKIGMEGQAAIAKISGNNRLETGFDLRTREYDINDLGYSSVTNYVRCFGHYGYRILQPTGVLNNMFLNFNLQHERRLEPDLYSKFLFNFNSSFTTRGFFNFGGGFETTPFGTNDIYEPRIEGRHVNVPAYYDPWVWFATDHRKKFAVETVVDWYKFDEKGRGNLILDLSPRYRISDRFNLSFSTNVTLSDKEKGFIDLLGEEIIFGERFRNTIVNSMGANYIFNNTTALNLAFRHYYSEVFYTDSYVLQENGDLMFLDNQNDAYNTTYNSWNLDLRFSWWFAPGSQMSLLYRNAVDSYLGKAHLGFSENFNHLFEQPQVNSLSLRISYYFDYNRIKDWFRSDAPPSSLGSTFASYRSLKGNWGAAVPQ